MLEALWGQYIKEFLLEKEPISQLIIASALPNLEEEIRKDLFFGVIVDENNEGVRGFSNESR